MEWQPKWRPIKTAPENTKILVCVTINLGPPEAGYETTQWVDWHSQFQRWPVYRKRMDIPFPPTHWMPLPPPPKDENT